VDLPDRFEFPHALHTMLRLDPVNGRKYLDGWIAVNERAARLCEAALANETTDEAKLAAEFAELRRAHRARLTADRDQYAQAAEEARAVRTGLGP